MDAQATLNSVVTMLRGMYACSSNRDRRQLTLNLLALEDSLDGRALVATGLSLLSLTTEGAAVQAYGAVMLKNALRGKKATVDQLPLWDLLTWYCNEPNMNRLLCEDLRKLFLQCIYSAEQNILPRILEAALSPTDLASCPRHLLLLHCVVMGCMDPNFDEVDRSKVGPLKKSVTSRAEEILKVSTTTLFSFFSGAGGAAATTVAKDVEPLLEATCGIVGEVAPTMSLQALTNVGLAETLVALLRWQPTQRLAVVASAAVVRSADSGSNDRHGILRAILSAVVQCLPSCVASRDIALLDEVLTLLKEAPSSLTDGVRVPVCQSLVYVLSIPSIWFAEQVCGLLLSLHESSVTGTAAASASPLLEVNAVDLFSCLRRLVVKHRCDPEQGSDPEGTALSQEQLGFPHLYRQTFDSFRSMAGKLLGIVANLRPRESNFYTLQLLSELPDSAGTPADERTRAGYITQRSATFLAWEATAFMVDHLSQSFRICPDNVSECINALQQRRPADAVVTPLYLNMLSCFWRCPDRDRSLNVWGGTLDILFHYLQQQPDTSSGRRDLDEDAAQRRAHTLMVVACTDHAADMGTDVAVGCLHRIKSVLFSAKAPDRPFLYECVASLASSLPGSEAVEEFSALVDPVLAVARETTLPLTQSQFNDMILGVTREVRDVRDTVRGSVDILAAVFRRSRPAPHVLERLNALIPVLTHLIGLLHGINPSALPPEFRFILELSDAEKKQFLPGQSRQSDLADRKSPADLARLTLLNLRTALYQLVGAVCPLVPTEHLSGLLEGMVQQQQDGAVPINHIRTLTQKCLMPVGENHTALLCPVLSLVTTFFRRYTATTQQARATAAGAKLNGGKKGAEQDVVDKKQWFYFTKDVLSYARSHALENGAWSTVPGLLEATTALAIAVLQSGCDSRNIHHFSMTIMDLRPPTEASVPGFATLPGSGGASTLPKRLLESQQQLYAAMLRGVLESVQSYLQATNPTPSALPKDLDSQVYGITGPFVKSIPELSCCLESLGIPRGEIEKLHAQLIMCNSESTKRRKLKTMLVSFVTPQSG